MSTVIRGLALAVLLVLIGCSENKREKEIPKDWVHDFKGMTIREVNTILGEPTESASAKGYLYWIRQNGYERQVLKLVCSVECSLDEKPLSIIYFLYRDGNEKFIYSRELIK